MFPPNTKFLVVDDYGTMRKIMKKILLDLGYTRIEEADDGKPALEKVIAAATDNDPFGCVISDWNMPGMTGIDLLRGIRKNPSTAGVTIIMATAEGDQKNVVEAVQAGVDNYVVKPFTPATLAEKLQKAYEKHQAQQLKKVSTL